MPAVYVADAGRLGRIESGRIEWRTPVAALAAEIEDDAGQAFLGSLWKSTTVVPSLCAGGIEVRKLH